ncbi:MAG: amino acid ABC transporter substrate-binding protein [Dehalococcoidia bacterium]|nr:amino acid ABC transporter substrate-binding protein [Dehalococcoidia bacterium]
MTTSTPIKAGISASLTGQFETQGSQALAGLTAWADHVNESGGLPVDGSQRPVSLIHYDDGSMADNCRQNTERLIRQDRVDLLFGPYSAGLTTAAADVANEHDRLLWNHGGAGDALYARGHRNVVGVLTPADRYLEGVLPLIRQVNPDANRAVILRIDTGAFARIAARTVEIAAEEMGFTIDLDLRYRPSQFQFREIARHVGELGPDVVVAVGRIRHDIAAARALAGLPNRDRIGMAVVVATPISEFAIALGRSIDGFVGPSQWEPQVSVSAPDVGPPPETVMQLMERAGQAHSVPVDYPMAQAFASGLVVQRSLEEAGSLGDEALRTAAGDLDFTTFYGRFRIDENGRQIGRSVALVQRQEGRKVVVWPPEQAEASLRYPF